MKKVWLAGFIFVCMLVAACSSGTSVDVGGGEAEPPAQEPAATGGQKEAETETPAAGDDGPAELVFYSTSKDSEEAFNERYGDAIREQFPNYTIKYIQRVPESTDLEQLIASGQRIDILWDSLGSFPGSMINHDLKFDMSELLEKHGVDLSRFEPTLIDAAKQLGGGAIYGLPVENSTKVIFYNKDIFDKFGVDYPTDGMTWEQLHELANRLNVESDGAVYTGFSPPVNSMVLQNSYSMPLIDPETQRSTYGDEMWKKIIETELLSTANNPTVKKAMQQYRKGNFQNLDQFYKDKVLAMWPEGQLLPILFDEELSQMNWDMVAMPTYSDKPGIGYQSYPIFFGITNQAENKDAAMKVLKFLVSDEFQLAHSKKGNMTSLANEEIMKAMGSESAFKDKNYGAFFYNKFAPVRPLSEVDTKVNALSPMTNMLRGVINGEYDINTGLRMAEEEVNKAIDEALKK
ncbi:ABC transporter substrate-binding protein [Paenibacillus sp.]|uniref:ABC transporter substrate-binding protein n=1 Tax=Paenibacillus sp. TaxID=58172 RepID=UPI002D4F9AC5|nr:extracellular solute-binding protein [Paenibacillus sp.]HZG83999.1 extracellular solute-binding protein [Paenibacillus sp.]